MEICHFNRAVSNKGKKLITVPKNNLTAVHPSPSAALRKAAKATALARSMALKSPDHATDIAVSSSPLTKQPSFSLQSTFAAATHTQLG